MIRNLAILFAFALIIYSCNPVQSATLRPYTPGGSPCAGACSYEWARDKFGAPVGKPERMMIPQGSVVTQMSYAKKGKPFAIADSAILAEDEPGQGYEFIRDGQTYWMVQIDKCQNWAVMLPPARVEAPAFITPAGYTPVSAPLLPYTGADYQGGGFPGTSIGGGSWPTPCCAAPNPPSPPIPTVPIGRGFAMLLAALTILIIWAFD